MRCSVTENGTSCVSEMDMGWAEMKVVENQRKMPKRDARHSGIESRPCIRWRRFHKKTQPFAAGRCNYFVCISTVDV